MALDQNEAQIIQNEAQIIGHCTQTSERKSRVFLGRWKKLRRGRRGSFAREIADNHAMLRDKGISAEAIARGEERMVREHVGNYGLAYQQGYLGKGRPIIGGMDPEHLRLLMDGNDEDFLARAVPARLTGFAAK